MKFRYLLAAALTVSLAAPVLAADDKEGEAPKEKKVCRTERVTGSLVNQRRICMTKSEWDRLAQETRHDIEDIQRHSNAIPHQAGGNGSSSAAQ
jgi:hypothetical protein